MNDVVIRVEHLSKSYQYGTISHGTLHKDLQSWWARLRGKEDPNTIVSHTHRPGQSGERFWALHDISFDVRQGEIVGIIGRNGAGKSTLLKILSEITTPTKGCVKLNGRVGSLLEVGTGFHPELTGRENIYLNGAILGMNKREITKKFDEIVAFAEIEEFIDTPVKRYSSGMYVRLAFAIAAHLEPEILLVDEVLAVGDTQFQKKCLGKMEEVSKEGRTVLFVSHNMGIITQLCTRAIQLKIGRIAHIADTDSVVSQYLLDGTLHSSVIHLNSDKHELGKAKTPIFFTQISIVGHDGIPSSEIDVRYPFSLVLEYEIIKSLRNVELSLCISTRDGRAVLTTHQSDCSPDSLVGIRNVGKYRASIRLPGMFLMPGGYMVTIAAHEAMIQIFDTYKNILHFNIVETGTRFTKYQKQHNKIGTVILDLPWVEKKEHNN